MIRKMKMNKVNKMTIQLIIASIVIFIGLFLLICGFWTVPVGEISNSVLIAWGEVSTFAGALLGLDYTYKYKVFINSKDADEE